MNIIRQQLQERLAYRSRLLELAEPGMKRFDVFNFVDTEKIKEMTGDPTFSIDDVDEDTRDILFDYFVAIPLGEVIIFRNQYNRQFKGEVSSWKADENLLKELEEAYPGGDVHPEELELLPDFVLERSLVKEGLQRIDDEELAALLKRTAKHAFQSAFSGDFTPVMKDIAETGRRIAIECIKNQECGLYRDFEWDIIEQILRTPVFPEFYEQCVKEADAVEMPYKFKKWPKREFFLRKDERGKGVGHYIQNLHPEVDASFDSEEGYRNFKLFMEQVASYGGIKNDAYMEALLQLITGYHFDGAAAYVKWDAKDHNGRILFYIIKYISTDRARYSILQKNSNVVFTNMDAEEYAKLFDRYDRRCDPSPVIQGAKDISDSVISSLHASYPEVFPADRKKA